MLCELDPEVKDNQEYLGDSGEIYTSAESAHCFYGKE